MADPIPDAPLPHGTCPACGRVVRLMPYARQTAPHPGTTGAPCPGGPARDRHRLPARPT